MVFLRSCGLKIPRHYASIIRYRYFRLLDLGMPDFFPLKGKVAGISGLGEQLHLALHGHLATPGENIVSLAILHARVLQVRVPDISAKLLDCDRGVFFATDVSMVRIPEQSDVRRAG